jgi:hypothetical protein
MKAILEFDLPDDEAEFNLKSHGDAWALVAWEMDQKLRGWLKYGHTFKTINGALTAVRDMLHAEIRDRGINLDDIV